MTLFDSKPDTLDGFEAFWATFPRDGKHPSRKSGKAKCKQLWKVHKLWKVKGQVMAALKEDIDGIKRGAFKRYKEGSSMECFPGPQPWLHQGKYDRDLPEPKEARKNAASTLSPQKDVRMTSEEFEKLKPHLRKLAKIKEKP